VFYLVKENDALPAFIDLPAAFSGSAKEVLLSGYPHKLKVKQKEGKIRVMIPKIFLKESASSPALVFSIQS
jgi:hypothetical protein